jgi:hypothetical protein
MNFENESDRVGALRRPDGAVRRPYHPVPAITSKSTNKSKNRIRRDG